MDGVCSAVEAVVRVQPPVQRRQRTHLQTDVPERERTISKNGSENRKNGREYRHAQKNRPDANEIGQTKTPEEKHDLSETIKKKCMSNTKTKGTLSLERKSRKKIAHAHLGGQLLHFCERRAFACGARGNHVGREELVRDRGIGERVGR